MSHRALKGRKNKAKGVSPKSPVRAKELREGLKPWHPHYATNSAVAFALKAPQRALKGRKNKAKGVSPGNPYHEPIAETCKGDIGRAVEVGGAYTPPYQMPPLQGWSQTRTAAFQGLRPSLWSYALTGLGGLTRHSEPGLTPFALLFRPYRAGGQVCAIERTPRLSRPSRANPEAKA
jgi:hypothetical protein